MEILYITLSVFLILSALSVFVICLIIYRVVNDKNNIELAKVELSVTPSDDDFNIIDKLINEEVNKYHVLITVPNNVSYINEEYVLTMSKNILKNVLSSISNTYLSKLKYIYNENKLEDIIYQKIQMAVIAYSVDINSNTNEE